MDRGARLREDVRGRPVRRAGPPLGPREARLRARREPVRHRRDPAEPEGERPGPRGPREAGPGQSGDPPRRPAAGRGGAPMKKVRVRVMGRVGAGVAVAGLVGVLLGPGGAGCVDVLPGHELPQTRYYSLDYSIPQREGIVPHPVTLRVKKVVAEPSVRRMDLTLHRQPPSTEVVPFPYHRWVSSPDNLVTERLRE